MNDIQELQRLASPAPKPQSLAWDGVTLWMGSRETRRLYAINPATWSVGWEVEAPGTPWGMTVVGPELPMVLGMADEFSRRGLSIFCPSRAAAELEGSKAFARDFMERHKIPSPGYAVCTTPEEAEAFVKKYEAWRMAKVAAP